MADERCFKAGCLVDGTYVRPMEGGGQCCSVRRNLKNPLILNILLCCGGCGVTYWCASEHCFVLFSFVFVTSLAGLVGYKY